MKYIIRKKSYSDGRPTIYYPEYKNWWYSFFEWYYVEAPCSSLSEAQLAIDKHKEEDTKPLVISEEIIKYP